MDLPCGDGEEAAGSGRLRSSRRLEPAAAPGDGADQDLVVPVSGMRLLDVGTGVQLEEWKLLRPPHPQSTVRLVHPGASLPVFLGEREASPDGTAASGGGGAAGGYSVQNLSSRDSR